MKLRLVRPYYHSCWEPLSLMYLAAYVRYHIPKVDVRILDGCLRTYLNLVLEGAESNWVGITATTPQLGQALQLARDIKRQSPRTKTVLGGYGPSFQPHKCFRPYVDHVVVGEGEEPLRMLVNGASFPKLVSLPPIPDIDSIPFPARDLVALDNYMGVAEREEGRKVTGLISSRGCYFNCLYCGDGYGKAWNRAAHHRGRVARVGPKAVRLRSPSCVADEMEHVRDRYRPDFLKFADAELNPTREHFLGLCRELVRGSWDVPWGCNMRVDKVDPEICESAVKAGCEEMWFGIESGSDVMLRHYRKGVTAEMNHRALRLAKRHGIRTRANILLGGDPETYTTIRDTDKLLDETEPDIVAFTILAPYPGTAYYDDLLREVPHPDWDAMDNYWNPYRHSDHLSNAELRSEQARLLDKYKDRLAPIVAKKRALGVIKGIG